MRRARSGSATSRCSAHRRSTSRVRCRGSSGCWPMSSRLSPAPTSAMCTCTAPGSCAPTFRGRPSDHERFAARFGGISFVIMAAAWTGPLDDGVLVVGTGLLGTSLGLALRRAGVEVWLRDQDTDALAQAGSLGAGRPFAGKSAAGLAVVAVPPAATAAVVAEVLDAGLA